MPEYRLTSEAEADIDEIVAYTIQTWDAQQADRYLAKLESCFSLLAGNPSIGRSCDSLRPGLRRFEAGKHVVFYIAETAGILVVRVLHQSMLPAKHF